LEITILYYSACAENVEFEQRIRDNILKHCGDIPIVSVTQKPIDFGRNICVGERKNMYINQFIQMLIGLREINTKYTLIAEADFLYPPEYFQFVPQEGLAYRYHDVYIMYCLDMTKRAVYYLKQFSDGAQTVNTEFFRGMLEDKLGKLCVDGVWHWDVVPTTDRGHGSYLIHRNQYQVWTGNPTVSFKTGDGVAKYTALKRRNGYAVRCLELPYWGNANALREKMFKKGAL
jgi:hypothetical protein